MKLVPGLLTLFSARFSQQLDISHSEGEISAAALEFLPHMPGTYLASLLIIGACRADCWDCAVLILLCSTFPSWHTKSPRSCCTESDCFVHTVQRHLAAVRSVYVTAHDAATFILLLRLACQTKLVRSVNGDACAIVYRIAVL